MAKMGAACSSCSNDRVIKINIPNNKRASIQEDISRQNNPILRNVDPFMNFIHTGNEDSKEIQSASIPSTESLNDTFSNAEDNVKTRSIRNDKQPGGNDFVIRYLH